MQRDLSSLWKRMPWIAGVAAVALLVAAVLLALSGERTYRQSKQDDLEVQAHILASSVTAALSFDDQQTAEEYLQALNANPEIRVAAIYGSDRNLFASYSRGGVAVPSHV